MKILAVDDDAVARHVLESALSSLGHDVVVAEDGEAGWTALQDTSIRVVVCDWRLPKLDGLDLCRRIRSNREDYVCFLLITQREATHENTDAALSAGVDEFLTKPIDLRELRFRLHVAERILNFTQEVRTLESFLPICGYCKKVRDDKTYWQEIETYMASKTGAVFSHGVCPDCYNRVIVPEMKALGVKNPPPFKN